MGRGKITDMHELVFLKLGGSLITDKTQPYTPRLDKLTQLVAEIKVVLTSGAPLRLVLGHGSGSFGHSAVKDHLMQYAFPQVAGTGRADDRRQYWHGFNEVWYRASQLNRLVIDALHSADVPAIALSPSALASAEDGIIVHWDLASLHAALEAGLLPVIYGDIVFDAVRGGVVLSTEKLMFYLAQKLPPRRILLAGLEQAVWADYPHRLQKVVKITPATYANSFGEGWRLPWTGRYGWYGVQGAGNASARRRSPGLYRSDLLGRAGG